MKESWGSSVIFFYGLSPEIIIEHLIKKSGKIFPKCLLLKSDFSVHGIGNGQPTFSIMLINKCVLSH